MKLRRLTMKVLSSYKLIGVTTALITLFSYEIAIVLGEVKYSYQPQEYFITISPFSLNKSYSGTVLITGTLVEPSDSFYLHSSKDITILSLKVSVDNLPHTYSDYEIDEDTGLLSIHLPNKVEPGFQLNVSVTFAGTLKGQYGIFLSYYTDSQGDSRAVIATEFQPNFARSAFPCLDDPFYKAVFHLKLQRPREFVSLSNTPLKSTRESENPDYVWDEFEPTPKMSTYILAFVVGNYTPIKCDDINTVWVPPHRMEEIDYACNLAPVFLTFMETFTDFNYSLPKLDHISLPFMKAKAMENWGLITYREDTMFHDKRDSRINKELASVSFIAHEIAHQWFGNLVTCQSWLYSWLNEGITTYMQILMVHQSCPSYKMMDLFAVSEIPEILFSESITPKSLINCDDCNNDKRGHFTLSIYYKGAAIMRMVEHVLTREVLQTGLQKYIQLNQYNSVNESSLWDCLQNVANGEAGIGVESFLNNKMRTWTHNKGYPLLTVSLLPGKGIILRQELFHLFPKYSPKELASWWIPLSYTTSTELNFYDTTPKLWFEGSSFEKELNLTLDENEWIIFNLQRSGLYRVNYDPVLWNALTNYLMGEEINKIHPLNRAQIIDDVFTMAVSGKINYTIALNLSKYLKNETHYYPWSAGIKALESIRNWMEHSKLLLLFDDYTRNLLNNIYLQISAEDHSTGDPIKRLFKIELSELACKVKHPSCEEAALKYVLMEESPELSAEDVFKCTFSNNVNMVEYDSNIKIRNIDLHDIYFCTAARNESAWEKIWQLYQSNYETKQKYLNSLCCTDDEDKINKLLEDIFLKNDSSSLDTSSIVVDIFNNFEQTKKMHFVLDFFISHFSQIQSIHSNEDLTFYVETVCLSSLREEEKEKLISLIKQHSDVFDENSLIEQIPDKNKWVLQNYDTVLKWLEKELGV